MTWRTRIATFGSCGLLVIAGAVCAALAGGEIGQIVGFGLIGAALIIATGLVFLEVGLSEDRERAREQQEAAVSKRPQRPRRLESPRLGRSRGHRRRLG